MVRRTVLTLLATALLVAPMVGPASAFHTGALPSARAHGGLYQGLHPAALDELFDLALSVPEVRQLLGGGTVLVWVRAGPDGVLVTLQDLRLVDVRDQGSPGDATFLLQMSRDTFLSISNAHAAGDEGAVLRHLVSTGALHVSTTDLAKSAALKAVLSGLGGGLQARPFAGGSVRLFGQQTTATSWRDGLYQAQSGGSTYVLNRWGSPIGALSRGHVPLSSPPTQVPVFFGRPPGVLAQNPGLIYDTVTQNPNVLGPHNVFRINPGLVGPNQILANNPGLLGPADIGLLNPNLHGPREFAYVMGIGAHSNTAQTLLDRGLVNDPTLDVADRWGNRP